MDKLIIRGGKPLVGCITSSGAKNAVLPILAASLLTEKPVTIANVPHLTDVTTFLQLLGQMSVDVTLFNQSEVGLCASEVTRQYVPYPLMRSMRASILVLGPLLARFGQADIALPGGCAIGIRPVDQHIKALRSMGADIQIMDGYIRARSNHRRLQATEFCFDVPTVTGTENLIMAAALAEGTSVFHNVAQEPEVSDLVRFLRALGANITGEGTATITVEGVPRLEGTAFSVLPDRIEIGTYLVAAAVTRGCVTVDNVQPHILDAVLEKLREAGAKIVCTDHSVTVDMRGKRPKAVSFQTAPFPGFPTDMQAQFLTLNAIAEGEALVQECIFENRLMHVPELQRMGADLELFPQGIVRSQGVEALHPAAVSATDLRASASLVLAALAAEGESEIHAIHHMDRGYERLEEKLCALGADITRISMQEIKSA